MLSPYLPHQKPPLWAIDPGIVAANASGMGLPMPVGLWLWPGGNWPDLSGQGNDGAIIGANIVAGDLSFNGTSDYVNCGTADVFRFTDDDFTLYCRVYPQSASANDVFFGKGAGADFSPWFFWVMEAGAIRFYVCNSTGDGWSYNTWTHDGLNLWYDVVGVKRGTNIKLYVNGIERDSDAAPATILDASALFVTIGCGYNTTPVPAFSSYANCLVSGAAIFPTAFAPSQVATLSADPYGLVRQPSMEELWAYVATVGGVAPTGVLYGPLFGPLGGPV